jgi:homoserine O-succinyltransferase/O-acetyltransferase
VNETMAFAVETPNTDGVPARDGVELQVAIVNNMPDSALAQTENQFAGLLAAGSGNHHVRLRRYTLPSVPRGDTAAAYIEQNYFPLANLYESPSAALIITGSDPREPEITDEPYWAELVELLNWSQQHTASTIVSCLSAHALLLTSDGVSRERLPAKCSGVYEQAVEGGDQLTRDLPDRIRIPHSRHNDVPLDALVRHGYQLAVSSTEVGWTIAQKQSGTCWLVLMQGHPEYDPITLLLEYRRDVRRYLLGERPAYPPVPAGYLAADAEKAMLRFREQAMAATAQSRAELVPLFPFDDANRQLTSPWREPAEVIYANWLNEVARRVRTPEVADAR